MSNKPTVQYVNGVVFTRHTVTDPDIINRYKKYLDADNSYEVASTRALDHPKLGCCIINTSIVVKKHADGSFETMNTLYVPVN